MTPHELKPSEKQDQDPIGPRFLTQSQAKALSQLSDLAQLAGHESTYGGAKARTKPLIVGPSGCGKTAVVARLCDLQSTPEKRFHLLAVNTASWIVSGARAEPSTLTVIRKFIEKHDSGGCIFLDELDKAVPMGEKGWDNGWSLSTTAEILSLLDCDSRLLTSGWQRRDVDRLRKFLIVGAGAWQRLVAVAEQQGSSLHDQIATSPFIPEEILFRFNCRLIEITLPTKQDFHQAIIRIHSDLGLPEPEEAEMEKLLDSAVKSRIGIRFLEQMVADFLCRYPDLRRPSAPESPADTSGKTIVSSWRYIQEVENAYRLLEELEQPLALLQIQFRLFADRFHRHITTIHDSHDEPVTAAKLDIEFALFKEALWYRYSVEKAHKEARSEKLRTGGRIVLSAIEVILDKETEFLASRQLLSLFAIGHQRLVRALRAWKYILSIGYVEES
jgi:hypothetical protein